MDQQDNFKNESLTEEENEEKELSYLWVIFLIATILLLFILVGFTFSLFDNTIQGPIDIINPLPGGDSDKDSIDFIYNYSDMSASSGTSSNGINMQNTKEMADSVGKKLIGSKNTFEFSLSGNTKNKPCQYIIALEKLKESTLEDSDVKIYLNKVYGGLETELFAEVPVYAQLEDIKIEGKSYKKLYTMEMGNNISKFLHEYILRMWIREGASNYYEKGFSVKVHILALGAGE